MKDDKSVHINETDISNVGLIVHHDSSLMMPNDPDRERIHTN
jgi:hypothetical protein